MGKDTNIVYFSVFFKCKMDQIIIELAGVMYAQKVMTP